MNTSPYKNDGGGGMEYSSGENGSQYGHQRRHSTTITTTSPTHKQHRHTNSYSNGTSEDQNGQGQGPISMLRRSSSSQLFHEHNYEPFIFAQSLTSVCLDPSSPPQNEWSPNDLIVPPPPNSIPNIGIQQFQSYLQKISSVYKIFKENQNKELIPTNIKTPEEIISLENIPEFFFRPNLTKSQILEYANSDPSPIMFQKLEHYSTIIEENIVGHVRDKSLDFFHAMHELKLFSSELELLYEELNSSREMLKKVDNELVKSSLNISNLFLTKNRSIDLLNRLSLVSVVKQAQPTLQLLLSKGDYGGALDLVHSTQNALNNLVSVSSLRHLSPQLAEMVKLIEKMLESDFNRIALNDDLLLLSKDNVDNGSNEIFNEQEVQSNINDMLLPIVSNLLRIGRVDECLASFRTVAIESVKTLFRSVIANKTYELEYQKKPDSILSKQFDWGECKIRVVKLSPSDSIPLFDAVTKEFKKKMTLIKMILDLVLNQIDIIDKDNDININNIQQNNNNNNNNSPNINSPNLQSQNLNSPVKSSSSQSSTLNENIKSTCITTLLNINETMQERLASLIKARSEINSKLPLPDFIQLNNQITQFIDFSETLISDLSGGIKKKATSLRSMQLTQLKLFLEALHKHKISHISLILENEEWIPVIVASEFQNIMNNIVDLSLDSNSPLLQSSSQSNQINNNNNQNNQEELNEFISISGEKFKVGNTTLMLLKFIDDYLQCIEKLPILVVDSIPKIAELLHTFNGMTYQLVLGAGARQLMKMKTITSKHLGLTSQCLSFIIKLIPYLKTILQRYLTSKNQYPLLNIFDKLLQDYSTHRSEIFGKFVAILRERSLAHFKALSVLDLRDDSIPIPSPPFAGLIKDITTLHKLLLVLMPPDQIFKVFTSIYYMFNNLFIETLPKFENLSSKSARRRIHNDVVHLLASLRKLTHAGDPGDTIEEFIKTNLPIN